MLTKIITTAIAVVVLAAPTSAFYEACFYSDNECTTKVDCLTADEFAEAVTDDASDDDYGPNNMTSCDDYFDMYNEQDHDHDFTMNVTVFESCHKNVSPCVSLQCKGTALSTACIADCDTKCAECSTSKEASQEETCKMYHCPSTIPGTTTKYLSSQSDCLKTTTMKTTTAAGDTQLIDAGISQITTTVTPATLSYEIELKGDISKMSATELTDAKAAAKAMAAKAGKFDPSKVDKIVFTQNGVELRRRRANANGPITITFVFKADADVNMDAVLTSLNAAITAGSVTLEVTIGGEVVTGAVTKAATGVAAVGAGAATVSAKMVTALAALTVGVAAAW